MDWTDLAHGLATGVLMLAAYAAGRTNRLVAGTGPKKPICPCQHGIQNHEKLSGPCVATIQQASRWDSNGEAVSFEWVRCACQGYCGPELISSVTMRSISKDEDA